jgi:hypothetical protein
MILRTMTLARPPVVVNIWRRRRKGDRSSQLKEEPTVVVQPVLSVDPVPMKILNLKRRLVVPARAVSLKVTNLAVNDVDRARVRRRRRAVVAKLPGTVVARQPL